MTTKSKPKSKNANLRAARKAKSDEFYTQLADIEKELGHYKSHFKGKVIFCNCDDPEWSNFFKYFALNFRFLGLKKLISTHYAPNGKAYRIEVSRDINDDGKINLEDAERFELQGDGDFRSDESRAILDECDIVVTNPPFSLFREYVDLLVESGKKFLIVGSQNAITYKETFNYIRNQELWLGVSCPKVFTRPDGSTQTLGNCCWFTNLTHKKRNDEITLFREHSPEVYPEYDNYFAINVDKVTDIPVDYFGVMGVPLTFLLKHNPKQFRVIGFNHDIHCGLLPELKKSNYQGQFRRPSIDGKLAYVRVFVQRVDQLQKVAVRSKR